jgi:hypothetical protein
MSLPGFTAEASFSKTGTSYRAVVSHGQRGGQQRVVSQARVGGGVGAGRAGFHCDGGSCRCDGDADCNDMFSTNVCGPNAYCYLGWLTGEWVCICQR